MNKYPDFIRFHDVIGYRKGYCKLNNIHDGVFYFTFEDGKDYILPKNSIILIIRNVVGK